MVVLAGEGRKSRDLSVPASAWAWATRQRLTRSPTTFYGTILLRWFSPPDDVRKNSPKSLSLVELRSPRDLAIFRKIYDHSFRIGDNAPGWEITYATEFHMTNDSKLFPPLEKWEAKGIQAGRFRALDRPGEEVALPLYEGWMIGQFDFSFRRAGWAARAEQPSGERFNQRHKSVRATVS